MTPISRQPSSDRLQASQSELRHGRSQTPPKSSNPKPYLKQSPNVVRRDQAAAWLAPSTQSQPQAQLQSSHQAPRPIVQQPPSALTQSNHFLPASNSAAHFHVSQSSAESSRRSNGRSQSDSTGRAPSSTPTSQRINRASTSIRRSSGTSNTQPSGINAHTFYAPAPQQQQPQASHRSGPQQPSSVSYPSNPRPKQGPVSFGPGELVGRKSTESQSRPQTKAPESSVPSTSHDRKHALPASGNANINSRNQGSSTNPPLIPTSKSSVASSSGFGEVRDGKSGSNLSAEVFGGKRQHPSQLIPLGKTPQVQEKVQMMEEESPDPLNVISPAMRLAQDAASKKNGSPLSKKRKDESGGKGADNQSPPKLKKMKSDQGGSTQSQISRRNSVPRSASDGSASPEKESNQSKEESQIIPDSQPQFVDDSDFEDEEEEELDEMDSFIPLNTPQSERPSDLSSAQSSGRLGRVSMGPVKMSDKRSE